MRSLNGSSGARISLSVKFSPSSSGQNLSGSVPLGLNMTTSRFFAVAGAAASARAKLGRFQANGIAAAERPRPRRNSRRVVNMLASVLVGFVPLIRSVGDWVICLLRRYAVDRRRRGNLNQELLDIKFVFREGRCQVLCGFAAVGARRVA